jgi:transcriptional regulator with XRE-family HTH domain
MDENVKMLRRKIVGNAVRQLREHLKISRNSLARLIDEKTGKNTTDASAVARWERGRVLPQPWKRGRLAEIAEANGRKDLADCFRDPVENWRTTMIRSNDDFRAKNLDRLLTLMEIVAINMNSLEGSGDPGFGAFEVEFIALREIADSICRRMFKKFSPNHPPILLDDHQRSLWSGLVADFQHVEKVAEWLDENKRARSQRDQKDQKEEEK